MLRLSLCTALALCHAEDAPSGLRAVLSDLIADGVKVQTAHITHGLSGGTLSSYGELEKAQECVDTLQVAAQAAARAAARPVSAPWRWGLARALAAAGRCSRAGRR